MLSDALSFLVRNLAGFFILNLLLRFYLQVARASFAHPLAQFTVKLTNFAVLPMRRIVPSMGGYDSATLLLAWLSCAVMELSLLMLSHLPFTPLSSNGLIGLALLAILALLQFSLYLLFGAVVMQAILSWVNPYNPLSPILDALTRPYLLPIRRILPSMGGLDLSPFVLILILQLILQFLIGAAELKLIAYAVLG
ncbi:YggT family protein [Chitinimonas sp.]|uniref:YggT family protein n=1 Tax=Chitinimonas sp. TaxID=1934313 RepID=UPI0035B0C300